MRVAYVCREPGRISPNAVKMAEAGHDVVVVGGPRPEGIRWVPLEPPRVRHEYFTERLCHADRIYDTLQILHAEAPLDAVDFVEPGGDALTVLRAKRLMGAFPATTVVVRPGAASETGLLDAEFAAFAERYCREHADVVVAERSLAPVVGGSAAVVRPPIRETAEELTRLYDVTGSPSLSTPPDDLVSVVVPVYNQGRYLGEALSSVRQSGYPHVEVVVVDDGSTENETIEALDALTDVVKIRQPNRGLSAARNAGLAAATGRYVVPLDADDRLAPGFLRPAVEALRRHPGLGYVTGRLQYFGLLEHTYVPVGHVPELSLVVNTYARSTGVFRRDALTGLGGYDEDLPAFEDWDLHWRFHIAGYDSDVLPITGQHYRRHHRSMSFGADDETRSVLLRRLLGKHAGSLRPEQVMALLHLVAHLWKTGYEPSASVRLRREQR